MALSGKYITIDSILEKIYRDFGFEDSLDWNDAIEWAAEALDLIGAPRAFVPKITDGNATLGHPQPIVIENFRGKLPCDLHAIQATRDCKTKVPLIYASDVFHTGWHSQTSSDLRCNSTENCVPKNIEVVPSTDVDDNTHCNPFFNFNPNPTSNTPYGANVPTVGQDLSVQPTYTLTNGHIFTSFKEGSLEMAYWAFPTDEKGLPMIPQETRFQNAVSYYIAHKLSFKLSLADKFNPNKAEKLEQQWLFYVQSAKNKATLPSLDQMESIKNQWLRLIPRNQEHFGSFKYLNEEERYINHNAR